MFISEMDAMLGALATVLTPSLLALDLGTAEPKAMSKGLPGVFGVLAVPKEANAPDPRPKALEAPLVGETRPPPGVIALDFPPWDDGGSPWRFKDAPLRLTES